MASSLSAPWLRSRTLALLADDTAAEAPWDPSRSAKTVQVISAHEASRMLVVSDARHVLSLVLTPGAREALEEALPGRRLGSLQGSLLKLRRWWVTTWISALGSAFGPEMRDLPPKHRIVNLVVLQADAVETLGADGLEVLGEPARLSEDSALAAGVHRLGNHRRVARRLARRQHFPALPDTQGVIPRPRRRRRPRLEDTVVPPEQEALLGELPGWDDIGTERTRPQLATAGASQAPQEAQSSGSRGEASLSAPSQGSRQSMSGYEVLTLTSDLVMRVVDADELSPTKEASESEDDFDTQMATQIQWPRAAVLEPVLDDSDEASDEASMPATQEETKTAFTYMSGSRRRVDPPPEEEEDDEEEEEEESQFGMISQAPEMFESQSQRPTSGDTLTSPDLTRPPAHRFLTPNSRDAAETLSLLQNPTGDRPTSASLPSVSEEASGSTTQSEARPSLASPRGVADVGLGAAPVASPSATAAAAASGSGTPGATPAAEAGAGAGPPASLPPAAAQRSATSTSPAPAFFTSPRGQKAAGVRGIGAAAALFASPSGVAAASLLRTFRTAGPEAEPGKEASAEPQAQPPSVRQPASQSPHGQASPHKRSAPSPATSAGPAPKASQSSQASGASSSEEMPPTQIQTPRKSPKGKFTLADIRLIDDEEEFSPEDREAGAAAAAAAARAAAVTAAAAAHGGQRVEGLGNSREAGPETAAGETASDNQGSAMDQAGATGRRPTPRRALPVSDDAKVDVLHSIPNKRKRLPWLEKSIARQKKRLREANATEGGEPPKKRERPQWLAKVM